jgi:translation elongation factor Ts
MAQITAQLVNELRAKTGVSMMECKKALVATEGDIEAAIKILRELGVAVAAKRAEKVANQGIIAAKTSVDGFQIAMVEVNCETDFVARNSDFVGFVDYVAGKALATDGDVAEELKGELDAKIAAIGENLKIRRSDKYKLQGTGRLDAYIHMGGKVGVIIEVAATKAESVAAPEFAEVVHDIALQVAASNPRWLDRSEVPADVIAAEREIYAAQMKDQNKPANILEKIIDGKVSKFFTDVCLVDQVFVKDGSLSISKLLEQAGKKLGDTFEIKRFVRYQLGA